jgi:tryptophan halogenase
MTNPIRKVLIVGGGTAGWMTAAALSKVLDTKGVQVTLVESDQISTVGVGEATIPPITTFNQILGIDEAEFMRATKGSFKLAIEFRDWMGPGHRYLHPFGNFGLDIEALKFHQFWLRAHHEGWAPPIDDFNLPATAATDGKFMLPSKDPGQVLSSLKYAFHFDASLYAKYLRGYAEQRGVTRVEGKVASVGQDGETGFITGVTLEDGRVLEADLFVDCTGFRALLIEQTLKTGFEDWGHWLANDRAVALQCEMGGDGLSPFTRATAHEAGWVWRIPLQHRIGTGYVYSSKHISDEDALKTLEKSLDGAPTQQPNFIKFRPGRRKQIWNKNVVAIGLSSGFLEPLESTSIHMIQAGITKLLALFPDRGFNPVEIAEYNRLTILQVELIRDFIILHFHANNRPEPYWQQLREMEIPADLKRKMDLFRASGRLFQSDYDLFAEPSWIAVLLGQGVTPERHDPLVDQYDEAFLKGQMARLASVVRQTSDALPTHEQFIARYCAAPGFTA